AVLIAEAVDRRRHTKIPIERIRGAEQYEVPAGVSPLVVHDDRHGSNPERSEADADRRQFRSQWAQHAAWRKKRHGDDKRREVDHDIRSETESDAERRAEQRG